MMRMTQLKQYLITIKSTSNLKMSLQFFSENIETVSHLCRTRKEVQECRYMVQLAVILVRHLESHLIPYL